MPPEAACEPEGWSRRTVSFHYRSWVGGSETAALEVDRGFSV